MVRDKGESLINVVMTALSMLESSRRVDPNIRRHRNRSRGSDLIIYARNPTLAVILKTEKIKI